MPNPPITPTAAGTWAPSGPITVQAGSVIRINGNPTSSQTVDVGSGSVPTPVPNTGTPAFSGTPPSISVGKSVILSYTISAKCTLTNLGSSRTGNQIEIDVSTPEP
ncbi:MAG TPA: hypothetical protein VFA20_00290 [Myxococcaceae bacterium]|nr:hypothetical protein [Myxococcaceae bacterium]